MVGFRFSQNSKVNKFRTLADPALCGLVEVSPMKWAVQGVASARDPGLVPGAESSKGCRETYTKTLLSPCAFLLDPQWQSGKAPNCVNCCLSSANGSKSPYDYSSNDFRDICCRAVVGRREIKLNGVLLFFQMVSARPRAALRSPSASGDEFRSRS